MAKIPWHRPVIVDITPPNGKWRRPMVWDITPAGYGRPTAEQADARHGEIEKHHQKQRQRRAEENPEKPEDLRLAHLRWSELKRLMRLRYRTAMPDTAEARRDLEILIGYAILTSHKPQHIAEIWAPWMDQDEADHIAAQRPILHRADDLAHKLDLSYCDRQRLAIHTIGAVDVDQTERDRLRRERCNQVKRQKRAAKQEEPTMRLTPRQRTVLEAIGNAETAVPDLVDRLTKRKVFKGASMRQRVHETLDMLRDNGLITDRYAPAQKGPVRHVKASATVARRA